MALMISILRGAACCHAISHTSNDVLAPPLTASASRLSMMVTPRMCSGLMSRSGNSATSRRKACAIVTASCSLWQDLDTRGSCSGT